MVCIIPPCFAISESLGEKKSSAPPPAPRGSLAQAHPAPCPAGSPRSPPRSTLMHPSAQLLPATPLSLAPWPPVPSCQRAGLWLWGRVCLWRRCPTHSFHWCLSNIPRNPQGRKPWPAAGRPWASAGLWLPLGTSHSQRAKGGFSWAQPWGQEPGQSSCSCGKEPRAACDLPVPGPVAGPCPFPWVNGHAEPLTT